MKAILLVGIVVVAILDWLAVWRQWRRVGYFAKPFTIVLLFTWLASQTSFKGATLWFALGLILSLAGDIFLMLPPRFFMPGLACFALVHLAYFSGFISPPQSIGSWIAMVVIVCLGIPATLLMKKIIQSQLDRGLKKMAGPTLFYALLINLMIFSAILTFFRTDWTFDTAILVGFGACLFYISDLINAWIRFVTPLRTGRVTVMVSYHLGQILIISGVVGHFNNF